MVVHERKRPDVSHDESDAKEGASRPTMTHRKVSYSNPSPADQVRDLIQRLGISQRAAARELDVDERTVRYWCAGKHDPPRMAILALERLIELCRTVAADGRK